MERITLRERGSPVRIKTEEARQAWSADIGDEVAGRGFLGTLDLDGELHLVPKQFVGRIFTPDLVVEILPKMADVFVQLSSLADDFSQRQVPDGAVISSFDRSSSGYIDAASQFLRELREAIAAGIPKVYKRHVHLDGPVRGRILFGASTQRHWSRGSAHRAVSQVISLDHDVRLTAVIREANRALSALPFVARAVKSEASDLLLTLAASQEQTDPRTLIATLADDYSWHPQTLNLLHAADQLLRGSRRLFESHAVGTGVATLCNTDRLWEVAVAHVVNLSNAETAATIHPFGSNRPKLFSDGSISIDPDIAQYDNKGRLIALLDAKNSIAAYPSSADVYQILAYVNRLNSPLGMLVYLADREWLTHVGSTSAGHRLFALGVDKSLIKSSLAHLLQRIPT